MSENPPEAPLDEGSRPEFTAPADTPEAEAKGYAVYNTTLGQYVSPVTADKPSKAEAAKFVPEGHTHRVVRV